MKPQVAIETMWQNLNKSALRLERGMKLLRERISKEDADAAGELIKDLLSEMMLCYTRLGAIAALEEIHK